MHYLEPSLSFANQYPGLAYIMVFLTALAESALLAGMIVPGGIMVFAFAAMVATGQLALWPVLLMAIAGAMAGDSLGYWLGYRSRSSHAQLRIHRPFSNLPYLLGKADDFLARHGTRGIFFARFVGIMRSAVPRVAGMQAMGPAVFFSSSLLAAIGWALLHVLPGLAFGILLVITAHISHRLAVVLVLLSFSVWMFFWICRRVLFIAAQFEHKWLVNIRSWAQAQPSGNRLIRLGQRFFAWLFSLGEGAELLAAFLGMMLLAAASGFAAVVQDVLAKDSLIAVDQSVNHFFAGLRNTWTDTLFVAVTELGDAFVNTSLVIAIFLVLLLMRRRRTALFWLLTAVGGSLGMQFLKWFFHLPRPADLYEGISSYSFPSGHTTMSVVLYGFLAIILAKNVAGIRQWLFFSTVLVIAFFIGFSRLYLGAHWFSDVLAGSLIGASWAALMGIIWLQGAGKRIQGRWLFLTVLVVLCSVGTWHVMERHEHDMRRYAPQLVNRNLDVSTWQSSAWQQIPASRQDMAGTPGTPLSLQWAGQPETIRQLLISQGWHEAPWFGLQDIAALLGSETPINALPVLPQLHEGRKESLLMVREGVRPNTRQVLRLWAEHISVSPQQSPLFAGTIEEQHSRRLGPFLTLPQADGNSEELRRFLAQELRGTNAVQVQEVQRNQPALPHEQGKSTDWQGQVLLIWPDRAAP